MSDTFVAQEGGDHYQAEYQHWDWVPDIELGYLEGNATKYVDRYKKKGIPIQDLKKAKTYVEKTIAKHKLSGYRNNSDLAAGFSNVVEKGVKSTKKFCESSGHDQLQTAFMMTMAGWQNEGDLLVGLGMVTRMLRTATEAAEAQQGAVATIGGQPATQGTGAQKTGASDAAGGQGQGANASSASTGSLEQANPFGYEGDE